MAAEHPAHHPADQAADQAAALMLGVDGGGSRCTAVLARRPATAAAKPETLGRGHGGPANPRVAGHEAARRAIDSAIAAAFADAAIPRGTVAAACLGLAGVGLADDRDAIRSWAERAGIASRVTVVPDGLLAFAAGDAEPWGVVLVAGTGSLALALPRAARLAPDGPIDRCGGWGPILGDEGSGHALGLATLKAAVRAADGRGPETRLREAVMRRFAAESPADLVARIQAAGVGRREIAAVARDALAAADAGDPIATSLVAAAAADLAVHVRTLADRGGFAADGYPLRLTGGLLTQAATLRRLVLESLAASGHGPASVTLVTDAAAAAARLAASAA